DPRLSGARTTGAILQERCYSVPENPTPRGAPARGIEAASSIRDSSSGPEERGIDSAPRLGAPEGSSFVSSAVGQRPRFAMYFQPYNPFDNVFLSTLVAAVPILTLLYFIALHPHRDEQGARHLGVAAPYAAFYAVIAALLVSCLAFKMPVGSAVSAFALGSLSGFLGIIWIVLAAMFLYTMTVITGKFEIVKESIVHISFDRRLQVLLIAFSFGAIIEGTSGFGTPVAIAGAVMVGLGFTPFHSAVLNL